MKKKLSNYLAGIAMPRLFSAMALIFIMCLSYTYSIAQVTLTDHGTTVELNNGIVDATFEKSSAKVLSLIFKGTEMLQQSGSHSGAYYSWNSDSGFGAPGNCKYTIKHQDANLVDLSFYSTYSGSGTGMDVDAHYVLKTGDYCLYVYSTLEHKSSYPAFSLGEYRVIWWMNTKPGDANNWLCEHTYHGDGVKDFVLPSPYDLAHATPTSIQEIVKLTTGVRNGLYDSKYEYSTALYDHPVVGNASDVNQRGIFVAYPSLEHLNQGPMYHDLVNGADIIHVYMNGDHYNGPTINCAAGESYKKFFGPFAIYCNNQPDGGHAFNDAKAFQANIQAQWPFTWLSYNTDYPQRGVRGYAKGTFKITDPFKTTINGGGAWIGLTQIDATNTSGDFQFESKNYQYWAKVNADGTFLIDHVRPGTYELFAYQNGEVGQYHQTNIVVPSGHEVNLGTITWTIPRTNGNLVWEIGVPNRSSSEFKFGTTDYFDGFNQEKVDPNFANPLQYDVASKDWANKLFYAHIAYPTGSTSATWRWNLNFNLANLPASGNATLTIAYASVDGASQGVFVNSTSQFTRFYPPNGGGNAFVRQSNFAKYGVSTVTIPVSQLKNGANFIGLEESNAGSLMYDYISLEIPGATQAAALVPDMTTNSLASAPVDSVYNKPANPDLVKFIAYPNPFTSSFKVNYTLKDNNNVRFAVYNVISSNIVYKSDPEYVTAGDHTKTLAVNCPPGNYVVVMYYGNQTKSALVIKQDGHD